MILGPTLLEAKSLIPDFASQQATLRAERQRYVCAFMMYLTNNIKRLGTLGTRGGGRFELETG